MIAYKTSSSHALKRSGKDGASTIIFAFAISIPSLALGRLVTADNPVTTEAQQNHQVLRLHHPGLRRGVHPRHARNDLPIHSYLWQQTPPQNLKRLSTHLLPPLHPLQNVTYYSSNQAQLTSCQQTITGSQDSAKSSASTGKSSSTDPSALSIGGSGTRKPTS